MNVVMGFGDTISNHPAKRQKDCERLIFGSPPSYKYAEVVSFTNCNNSGHYALAIGLNPALLNLHRFDSTNRKIAECFKRKGYSGYILLNLYSAITKDVTGLCTHIKSDPMDTLNNMQNKVLDLLMLFEGDIYLFWGPNAKEKRLITNPHILCYIEQTLGIKKYYYSADGQSKFVHPGCKAFHSFQKLKTIQDIL